MRDFENIPQERLTRRQRRQLERERRRQELSSSGTKRTLTRVGGVVLAVGAIIGGVYGLLRIGGPSGPKENLSPYFKGTFAASEGRDHIKVGEQHAAFKTNPPTSGPHYEDELPLGIYDEQQLDERLIHNLEHGHIWVSYNCPEGCPELVEQLQDVVKRHQLSVLEPRKENPNRIALAAWEYYDAFDEFDDKRIEAFFQQREDKGPEKLPPTAHKRK